MYCTALASCVADDSLMTDYVQLGEICREDDTEEIQLGKIKSDDDPEQVDTYVLIQLLARR